MSWAQKYIGIPYRENGRDRSGCDCGGLVLLALREEGGIAATDFNAYGQEDFYTRSGLVKLGEVIDGLMDEWVVVTEPQPFDLVRFRVGYAPCHVGIYYRDGKMLHVEKESLVSMQEDIFGSRWGRRFIEFRRHREMLGRGKR